jgi:hypothetical protein
MKLVFILACWSVLLLIIGKLCLRGPARPQRVYLFILCNGIWLTGLFWLLQQYMGGQP